MVKPNGQPDGSQDFLIPALIKDFLKDILRLRPRGNSTQLGRRGKAASEVLRRPPQGIPRRGCLPERKIHQHVGAVRRVGGFRQQLPPG
jgi:hypothetical protein